MRRVILPVLAAFCLWFGMFSPWTAPYLNFWLSMLFSASVLLCMSFTLKREWKNDFRFDGKSVLLGIGSACVLWGVFYVGDYLAALLFDFAKPQVSSIYSLRDGTQSVLIALELLLVVGPAEVIFWQGFVQSDLMNRLGDRRGFVLTTLIYSFVHISSFNFMLIMAALVCGVFWGFIYMFFRPRNLVPLLISHALWDVMVFILFPIV
ncbi:MAG: CPBP family intramembrane metalloprotease [Culturomica sp.]|jgi:membrane protease YdiL (CAAX protease family)|nr:CPBP family intramembrane metalloprotease [Culturomica sp.]